jgi:phosphatidylserine/phosphatidylglycerophosphate/cardiolipin synthase-like enzyme
VGERTTSRAIDAELLFGRELYQRVVLEKLVHARETVLISTANVKAMLVEIGASGDPFKPVVDLFGTLAARGVEVRLLHAELPSRPFRAAFDKHEALIAGGLHLKICPRVHFKAVIIDGAWMYIGSASLTGAGLGAKHADNRNFELGLVTEDFDSIDRVTALFESVWGGAECRACRLHGICPDPIGPGPTKQKRRSGKVGITLGKSRRFRR